MIGGITLTKIVQDQYYLSKRANISLFESNHLPLFEAESFLRMALDDMKEEQANYKLKS